jgi:heme-degrading monooxygenase HmoA
MLGAQVLPTDLAVPNSKECFMWIRLGSFKVKAGKTESLRATYNEKAVPRVRGCSGNLACFLLEPITPGDDLFVACTVWASRSDGVAYEESGTAQAVVDLVRDFFAGPPTLKSYESSTIGGL